MNAPIKLGAVIYDPKVTVIWGIIRDFFEQQGVRMDVAFFANYRLQVDALVEKKIDIAWNSPLAWLDAVRRTNGRCRALAMRDTDVDRVTHVVVRKGGALHKVEDLKGRVIGFGAKDSPQAMLIPAEHLRRSGLQADRDYTVKRFDKAVGLHGDHIGGELDAFKALQKQEVDASVMLDLNWAAWTKDGTIDANAFTTLTVTGKFDHCNFTALEGFDAAREKAFNAALFSMSYENPKHREMMDMEGLKAWVPGRTSGYALLDAAVKDQRYFELGGQ